MTEAFVKCKLDMTNPNFCPLWVLFYPKAFDQGL